MRPTRIRTQDSGTLVDSQWTVWNINLARTDTKRNMDSTMYGSTSSQLTSAKLGMENILVIDIVFKLYLTDTDTSFDPL